MAVQETLKLTILLVLSVTTTSQLCTRCGPCCCYNDTMVCTILGLSSVPSFDPKEVKNITRISMNVCQIRAIGDGDFSSFQDNSNVTFIDLDDNKIVTISDNAFIGVESVTTLWLNRNMLSFLPEALLKLGHLQELGLVDNPLLSLNTNIMSALGNTLTEFALEMKEMAMWPTETHSLRHLKSLFISNMNSSHVDEEMFWGFRDHILSLTFYGARLQTIPATICDLTSLHNFTIESAPYLNESMMPVFEPCQGRLSTVKSLSVINSHNLTVFPNLTRTFSSIQTLHFEYDMFGIMNTNSVSRAQLVTTFIANYNRFSEVPTAVNQFTHLTYLDLSTNRITNVNDQDFEHLTKLQSLNIGSNPIVYISNNAFQHNRSLKKLYLYGTRVHSLPSSLALLHSLKELSLSSTFVECTCNLANLKGWNVTMVMFGDYDRCYQSSVLIKDFILNDLGNC